jgi:hypothetical protein
MAEKKFIITYFELVGGKDMVEKQLWARESARDIERRIKLSYGEQTKLAVSAEPVILTNEDKEFLESDATKTKMAITVKFIVPTENTQAAETICTDAFVRAINLRGKECDFKVRTEDVIDASAVPAAPIQEAEIVK